MMYFFKVISEFKKLKIHIIKYGRKEYSSSYWYLRIQDILLKAHTLIVVGVIIGLSTRALVYYVEVTILNYFFFK